MTGNKKALAAAATAAREKEHGNGKLPCQCHSISENPVCQACHAIRFEILRMARMIQVLEWEP